MGRLNIDNNYLSARQIKECIHTYYKSKKSCLAKQAYLSPIQNGEHKLIRYKLKASYKDDYEHYICVKDIEGVKTNCGIVFYPYNLSCLFSIMNSCDGVSPGKLELHSNLYGYPKAKRYIDDSDSSYGFSFIFKDHLALKCFIEKYNASILSKTLTFDDICTDIKRDDLLVDIYKRTLINK